MRLIKVTYKTHEARVGADRPATSTWEFALPEPRAEMMFVEWLPGDLVAITWKVPDNAPRRTPRR